eukprot:COSAG01_NODE_8659_length_2705_cov_3.026477_2_plen_84_part_00
MLPQTSKIRAAIDPLMQSVAGGWLDFSTQDLNLILCGVALVCLLLGAVLCEGLHCGGLCETRAERHPVAGQRSAINRGCCGRR